MDNFRALKDAFISNDKTTDEWLTFKPYKTGSQCHAGFAYFSSTTTKEPYKCIYKISRSCDYSIENEAVVYTDLETLNLPFFCRLIAVKEININPLDYSNPFSYTSRSVKTSVLFIEYIRGHPLHNIYTRLNPNTVFYLLMHTLCILITAHSQIGFNHKDVHGGNICVRKCPSDLVIVYKIHTKYISVPTLGVYPVLIDYGMSYSESIKTTPIYSTLDFYHKGSCPLLENLTSDLRFASVSFAQFIQRLDTVNGERMCINLCNSLFFNIKMFKLKYSIQSIFQSLFTDLEILSPFIHSNFSECINLIKSLVVMPVEHAEYNDFKRVFARFIGEWVKIETQFVSHALLPWILKHIVSFVSSNRAEYLSSDDICKSQINKSFKDSTHSFINSIASYISVVRISFKIVMESLIMLASQIEGVLFTVLKSVNKNTINNNSAETGSCIVDSVYKSGNLYFDTYVYTPNTSIMCVGSLKRNNTLQSLTQNQASDLNQKTIEERGLYLHQICK